MAAERPANGAADCASALATISPSVFGVASVVVLAVVVVVVVVVVTARLIIFRTGATLVTTGVVVDTVVVEAEVVVVDVTLSVVLVGAVTVSGIAFEIVVAVSCPDFNLVGWMSFSNFLIQSSN